jgi:TatD DNase family protein
MFIDSHCHLDGPRFAEDRDEVLRRAAEVGIDTILLIGSGTGPGSLDCAIQIAENHSVTSPTLFATIGVHPHEAALVGEGNYEELTRLAQNPRVLAWGEIGLDYFYDHSPREVQRAVFQRQLELAGTAGLPIIIHCRPSDNSENAWDECLALIREHWAPRGLGGVLHCFTGTLSHAEAALEMGFMISFAGNVTFPKAQNIRDVAKEVPLDRMFIETDAPFLAPVPHRGKRNEPAFVKETARQIGELRGMSTEEVGLLTADNFRRFFSNRLQPRSL